MFKEIIFTKNTLEFKNDTTLATLTFTTNERSYHITSIVVSPILRGQGIAGKLMDEFCNFAEKNNKKILPICPYAISWFDKHPNKKLQFVIEKEV